MKISAYFLLFFFLLISINSCEEETGPFLSGDRYSHAIPNCDNNGNPEVNCTEWIEFDSESEASMLIGGGDIVETGKYTLNDNQVAIVTDPTSSFSLVFDIIDENSIRRLQDDSIWTKD